MRKSLITISALILVTGLSTAPAHADGGSCGAVTLPVSLAQGQAAVDTVAGTLCTPPGWGAGAPGDLDVLVAGATYTRTYWDWPQYSGRYSYVARTLHAGRATFSYDRPGTGASTRPPSVAVTLPGEAWVLHQVVRHLRDDPRVGRVTAVGHSLGSGIAVTEAGTHHDVDRVVATGMLHAVGSALVPALLSFAPAALDPQFLGRGYDLGYLTTTPGSRAAAFYAPSADPQVIAYDEAHKDVVSAVEFGGYPTLLTPALIDVSATVTAPVLAMAGRKDVLVCGGPTLDCADPAAVSANETAYYPASAGVTAVTIPDTGHDLALHPSADVSFGVIDAWIRGH